MIEQDTIRLYRECDSGVKMGISSIGDVVDHVKSDELRTLLIISSSVAPSPPTLNISLNQSLFQ